MKWRLLAADVGDGAWNMAADQYMMEWARQTGQPVLRFYGWSPPALSIGYFQKHRREVDEAGCRQLGITWIRRPTGGRAVLHEHEITYAVALPLNLPDVPAGINDSYQWLSRALVRGLRQLGVDAQLAPAPLRTRGGSSACFDSASRCELLVNGKKLLGSAQMRRDGVLLQHGSLLLEFDPDRLLRVMAVDTPETKALLRRVLLAKACSLEDCLPQLPSANAIMAAIAAGFCDEHGVVWDQQPWLARERQSIADLRRDVYLQDSWNRKF